MGYGHGIETLSSHDSNDYTNKKVFFIELLNELKNYQLSGHNAYISKRATKDWYK
tara:strand:- start:5905 stop:6069 length:165 start_codon:yes stop_codon:yes gene_type:complete